MMPVFPHQKAVFSELLRTAQTFFAPEWRKLPITPRFSRLIIGESGSGKSFLAGALADELNIPIWNATSTNWIPLGCAERGARQTWVDVAAFVSEQDRGVIFVDEVDKLGKDSSPWMTCVRLEIFSLIDHVVPENLRVRSSADDWDDDDGRIDVASLQKKLADSFLVLAAGAFQQLWEESRQGIIGFGGHHQSEVTLDLRRLSAILPTELTNRFAPPPLTIPPMVRTDYEALLHSTLVRLDRPTKQIASAVGARTLDAAITDRLGCRWIEQVLLETAAQLSVDALSKQKDGEIQLERDVRLQNEPRF